MTNQTMNPTRSTRTIILAVLAAGALVLGISHVHFPSGSAAPTPTIDRAPRPEILVHPSSGVELFATWSPPASGRVSIKFRFQGLSQGPFNPEDADAPGQLHTDTAEPGSNKHAQIDDWVADFPHEHPPADLWVRVPRGVEVACAIVTPKNQYPTLSVQQLPNGDLQAHCLAPANSG